MMVNAKPGLRISYLEGVQQNPKQAALHFPQEGEDWRFMVASTGQRAGKTIAAAAEVVWELSQGDPKSNRQIWICAPTYDLCDRMFEYVWEWVVRQGVLTREKIRSKSKTKDNRQIEMSYGSWVRCKSTDNGGESCVGEQLDFVAWDECAPQSRDIWEEKLLQRLANRKGRGLLTSSPQGFNWFKEYHDRGEDEDFRKVGWRSLQFSQLDNPFIDSEEVLAQKHTMAESVWEQDVMGNFVHFSGLVYPMFRDELYNPDSPSEGGHLFNAGDPPANLRGSMHLLSIDIGTLHPTAALWHALTPTNDIITHQEYLEEHPSHEWHAQQIRGRTKYPVSMTFISHDAARQDGLSHSPNTPAMVYSRCGLPSIPAIRDQNLGSSVVGTYMLSTLQHKPRHPIWLLSVDCIETRKCLKSYVWDRPARRNQERDPPQKARKFKDDLADALRYGMVSEPKFNNTWIDRARSADPMMNELIRYGYKGTPYATQAKKRGRRHGPRVAGV